MEKSDVNKLSRHATEDRRRVRQLEEAVSQLQVENESLQRERDKLLRSRSWRLTAPLRRFMASVRGDAAAAVPMSQGPATPETPHAPRIGRDALPSVLLSPEPKSVEGVNATCHYLNLSPGLDGLLSEPARLALDGTSQQAGAEYLGWREAPPPTIGFIGSEELRTELAFDARVIALDEFEWDTKLVPGALHFVVIETVWHVDHRHWCHSLVRDGGQHQSLMRLLEHCRRINLPIALWFRETPGNYTQFAWLAEHVDLVCAAEAGIVERLRRDYPRAKVEYLPAAIQPALHNPLRSYGLMGAADAFSDIVLYDGWWDLQNGLDDRSQLRELKAKGLLVAESEWDFGWVRLGDDPEFALFTIGCLGREEKLVMSRLQGGEVFPAAPLAGNWRGELGMVRSAAAGSLVARLDGAEPPLPELELPMMAQTGRLSALLSILGDPVQRARWRHSTWRGLMSGHTVAHRLQYMADALRVKASFLPPVERVACVLVSMRPERLPACIENFRKDRYPKKELVIVVNCDDADIGGLRKLVRKGESIHIFQMGRNCSLGACLNFALGQTDADYWTKMDDDDFYGPEYLGDTMLYQRIGKFDVFGKPPIFNYLESNNELIWDMEWARHANLVHQAGDAQAALVAGGTIGGRRKVLESVRFCERRRGGSDSDFIRRCYEAHLDVLAMDGFNFARFRSARSDFHTWNLPDDEVRKRGIHVGSDSDIARIVFS